MGAQPDLSLQNISFVEIKDLAGAAEYFGGHLFEGGPQVGNFAVQQRITPSGTDAQNTSQFMMTLFFTGATPPDNITLEGANDFSSGSAVGAVSAASPRFKAYIGQTFQLTSVDTTTSTLTIR